MISGESNDDWNGEVEPEVAGDDIEALRESLAEAQAKGEDYLANWQRAQADFVNYKRRSQQEHEEMGRFANSALMFSLLPVLDDLERAFTSVPDELDSLPWVDGVRLIERKLRTILEAQGLTPIEAMGETFDPNFHEATMQGKGKEGMVIEEIQKGYKFHERVIRPSLVVVGNGEEDREAVAEGGIDNG